MIGFYTFTLCVVRRVLILNTSIKSALALYYAVLDDTCRSSTLYHVVPTTSPTNYVS